MKLRYAIALAVAIAMCSVTGWAQISVPNTSFTYAQDFNTLPASGTGHTAVPAGWAFFETLVGYSGANTYRAGDASEVFSPTYDTYSLGAAGDTDRSLGSITSVSQDSSNSTIGVCFINNTGAPITSLTVTYTGETWRVASPNRQDGLVFQYNQNTTAINGAGTWTAFTALNYFNPGAPTVGGGSLRHSAVVSATISGLNIAPGNTFCFRWLNFNATAAAQGNPNQEDALGIDDFALSDIVACVPPTISCPTTQTVAANAMGNYTLADFTGSATVLDNCTPPTVTQLPTAGSTLGVGQHTIALTATDGSTNTAVCNFTLIVQALDCAGTPGGTAFLDNCNTCVGGSTGLTACIQDCNGDFGGTASIDQCGVCSGGNTGLVPDASCLDCEGVPNGPAQPGTACNDGDATTIDDIWTNDCQCAGTQTYVLAGNIVWEHDLNTPVAAATVALSGDDAGSDNTNGSGDYELETKGGNLTVTSTKNDNPRQGVDAADAARIRQHALGTLPFNDGYKVIAADVNESNAVTNADATIIQQALLGNAGAGNLLDNPAWRFVDAAHTFANENAPWGFPMNVGLTGVAESVPNIDFVGVKMGDVNGSGLGNLALTSQPATWLLPDAALEAGSTHRVAFALGESLPDVAALQFALRLDPAFATVSRILPRAALPLTREDFGVENLRNGELRTVFAQAQGQPLKAGEVVFELELTVRRSALLSEVLQLDNDLLDGRVYDTTLKGGAVKLAFAPVRDKPGLPTAPTYAEAAFELYQNVPNPFAEETIIAFSLPTDAAATITVQDASGRVVAQFSGHYSEGFNSVRFTRDALKGATGVLTYTVTAGTYTATRRMLVVE